MNKITIPSGFKVIKNEFLFENSDSDYNEDILQIEHISTKLIVDLGWYGDIVSKVGGYKIYVIKDRDWDSPINTLSSDTKEGISFELDTLLKSMD